MEKEPRGVKAGTKRGKYNVTKYKKETRTKGLPAKFTESELEEVKEFFENSSYEGRGIADKLLKLIREKKDQRN